MSKIFSFFIGVLPLLSIAETPSLEIEPQKFWLDSPGIRAKECRVTYGEHDFAGVTRPAICVEYPWKPRADLLIRIPLGIDMMNSNQLIDYRIERSFAVKASAEYRGGKNNGGVMNEKSIKKDELVSCIHRELVHEPSWASWIDCRRVEQLILRFSASGWSDTNATQKVWISDVRFFNRNSWAGTDRDELFKSWLSWCDNFEPDLSDSSYALEPPKEGRLDVPIKLVEKCVSNFEIIAPKDTYGSIELAARELKCWINKITNADIPVVEKPTGTKKYRIFLNSDEAHELWADDVKWLKEAKGIDGWFIHTRGNDIHIGCAVPNRVNRENAASFGLKPDACAVGVFRGAVAFLENNSTIIFAASDPKYGTVYDESPDFTVRWGEGRDRPATAARGWISGNDYSNKRSIPVLGTDMWRARNYTTMRIPHRLSGQGARAGEMIEYFPKTEAYQTFDGQKRIPFSYYNGQVCLSGPDALKIAISNGIAKVKRARAEKVPHPVTSIGFWNEDNWRVCVCEGCTKPIKCEDGTVLTSCGRTGKSGMIAEERIYRSTQYMLFVNAMADGIAKECPGTKTEILAYLFQYPAPKCKISDNVVWVTCPLYQRPSCNVPVFHPLNRRYYENTVKMKGLGGEMRVYDYHAFSSFLRNDTTGIEAAAMDYAWYTSIGATAIGSEMAWVNNYLKPTAMINGWLFSRIGWSADINQAEKLRKWFIRRVYREGAPAVEEYYARYRRKAFRGAPRSYKMLTGDEAAEVFGQYLDRIENPIAKVHFELLMSQAVGKSARKIKINPEDILEGVDK